MKRKLVILALTTLTALGASLVPAPAQAGHKHKQQQQQPRQPSVHRSHGHHAVHRSFVLPRHIRPAPYRTYYPHYQNRAYFRPHRHDHDPRVSFKVRF